MYGVEYIVVCIYMYVCMYGYLSDDFSMKYLYVICTVCMFLQNPRRAYEAEMDQVQKAVVFDPVKDLMEDESLMDA